MTIITKFIYQVLLKVKRNYYL